MDIIESISDGRRRLPAPQFGARCEPFLSAAADGRLVIPTCIVCGHRMGPPAENCSRCLSMDLDWIEVSGAGTVISYATYHKAWNSAFELILPYTIAIVELDEGVRLLTDLVDVAAPEVGERVRVAFEPRDGGGVVPVFSRLGGLGDPR